MEPYKSWQKAVAAGIGLAFATGATILIGVMTMRFPHRDRKDKER